ncbi:DUF2771 family protein [Mycobacterium sp. D16R24]|uniref:DUF2771 family protein n=1 Tax=Mycobacterium sp. D16R24 TaxID=1855656 RepID=UPI000994884D|nr:DUF2771 family protein [Mycobacterium sp. D16R24]
MKAKLAALAAVLVLTAAAMVGFIAWQLREHREGPDERPEISAFTHGTLVRVGPLLYCDRTLAKCDPPGHIVELFVNDAELVQLSVDSQISKGPWAITAAYAHLAAPSTKYGDQVIYWDHRSAVTVPTVDKAGRKLVGIEVAVPTVGVNELGEQVFKARATWSVATTWKD